MLLYQPKSGYCYNSDSIFLYSFITMFDPRGAILDIGCGVGILGILCGRDFSVSVTSIDKQEIMINYARLNFEINDIDAEVVNDDFLKYRFENRYDMIVSNPPFYSDGSLRCDDSVLHTARYSEHLPFEDMVAKVKKILKPRGYFLFCYDARRTAEVLSVLESRGLRVEALRFIHSKMDRESKTVMIAARFGSRSPCRILPPLIVFDEHGEYTEEAAEAFVIASAHSIKADM